MEMKFCEIILNNWEIIQGKATSQLLTILRNYSNVHTVFTVQKLQYTPVPSTIQKLSETSSEEESPIHYRKEFDKYSELYKLKNNVYMVKINELIHWYDDYDDVEVSEKTVFFRIVPEKREFNENDLTVIVSAKIELFSGYYDPLYYVIADLLERKANELTVKISNEMIFIEPWNDLCAPILDPFYLPFLCLLKH